MSNIVAIASHGTAWLANLSRGDRGVHPTVGNAILVIGNDAMLRGMIVWDEFASRVMITRTTPRPYEGALDAPGPYPRGMTDVDVTMIQAYLQNTPRYELRIGAEVAFQAVQAVARANPVHPVRQYLEALTWDGVPRLETWLHMATGCPNDAYHRAIGVKFLCAAVRRVMHPGTFFKSMLVLEGPQNLGKSTLCAELFGRHWFSDNLHHDLANRDSAIGLLGVWGTEVAELASMVSAKNGLEIVKAFISRCVDHYRPVNGKCYVDVPRQSVLIGTTNAVDWLNDPTGNTRFWPVACVRVEPGWVTDNRNQLWAEALIMEPDELIYLETDQLRGEAAAQQAERMTEDAWEQVVAHYLAGGNSSWGPLAYTRVAAVLSDGIGVPRHLQNAGATKRVRDIMTGLGWKLGGSQRIDGKVMRVWRPLIPPAAPGE